MAAVKLSHNDAGCWGDGSFGHQHTRERCANVLQALGCSETELLDSLRGPMPDDAWDEEEAEAWLNDFVSRPDGLWFGWLDGDFGLWELEDD